jgi:N-acetylglucosamine-6-phosphate deacetylase
VENGYFDLQVNGYGGVDLNSDGITDDEIEQMCAHLADDGVDGILATIITAPVPDMVRRIARVVAAREARPAIRQRIAGIHIEGPFINPAAGYRGAHDAQAIIPPALDEVKRLHDACGGLLRILTLAPECDEGFAATRWLAGQGVVVSAGHCDPSLETLQGAADAGLTLFTHTGNGCPMLMHRHDNVIQRALALHDRLTLCFIADGVHIPFFALGNYLRACGIENAVVVTDAMQAAGMGPGLYGIGAFQVLVGEDLAAWAPDRSHLVGSAGTMKRTAANLRDKMGLAEEDVRRLTCINPRRVLERCAKGA